MVSLQDRCRSCCNACPSHDSSPGVEQSPFCVYADGHGPQLLRRWYWKVFVLQCFVPTDSRCLAFKNKQCFTRLLLVISFSLIFPTLLWAVSFLPSRATTGVKLAPRTVKDTCCQHDVSLFRSKCDPNNSKEGTYQRCFSAYMSMQCANAFPVHYQSFCFGCISRLIMSYLHL